MENKNASLADWMAEKQEAGHTFLMVDPSGSVRKINILENRGEPVASAPPLEGYSLTPTETVTIQPEGESAAREILSFIELVTSILALFLIGWAIFLVINHFF